MCDGHTVCHKGPQHAQPLGSHITGTWQRCTGRGEGRARPEGHGRWLSYHDSGGVNIYSGKRPLVLFFSIPSDSDSDDRQTGKPYHFFIVIREHGFFNSYISIQFST